MTHIIIRNILVAALGLFCLTGCDNIADDERYLPVEKPVLPPHAVPRTLLIQEFTGNNCRNCPDGADAIHKIMEANPGRVVAVGLHPEGGYPNTMPMPTAWGTMQDFRCPEAQVVYSYYKPSGFPCAVFNGTEMSTVTDNWLTIATAQLAEPARLSIEASIDFARMLLSSSYGSVVINYTITATDDIPDDLNIMAWVIENSILGTQNNHGTFQLDYVHNHVLRCSLNGDWGEPLAPSMRNGQILTGTITGTLDMEWEQANCQVVLFVFRTADKAVEQTILLDLK